MSRFPIDFWQKLLGAEVSPIKARDIIASLDPLLAIDFDALSRNPLLTSCESERMSQTVLEHLHKYHSNTLHVIEESDFPETLIQAENSPTAFFYEGNIEALHAPLVGIVGTREATVYGRAVARKFSERLAEAGVTVVSGGALGIDAASHEGALAVGGRTIAVMGSGLDQPYPAMHRGLFQKISVNGGLLST